MYSHKIVYKTVVITNCGLLWFFYQLSIFINFSAFTTGPVHLVEVEPGNPMKRRPFSMITRSREEEEEEQEEEDDEDGIFRLSEPRYDHNHSMNG